MKTLILKKNKSSIFFKCLDNKDIDNYYKIKEENFLFRIVKKFNLSVYYLFLGKWTTNIRKYERVIMFDNGADERVAKYIKRKNPKIKIIMWYWNPVNEYSEKFLKSKYIDQSWSYNKVDVKKYRINYNTQFYTSNVKLNKNTIKSDVVFLGNDKGREKDILEIENKLKEKDIITNFKIIKDKKSFVRYDEYLEIVSKSRAILDYNTKTVSPLTLRPMEALFLNKKLITNNKDIENYDFYNSNNIFILGKDNIDNIKKFIETPYEKIDEEIVKNYDFEKWIKRFDS